MRLKPDAYPQLATLLGLSGVPRKPKANSCASVLGLMRPREPPATGTTLDKAALEAYREEVIQDVLEKHRTIAGLVQAIRQHRSSPSIKSPRDFSDLVRLGPLPCTMHSVCAMRAALICPTKTSPLRACR